MMTRISVAGLVAAVGCVAMAGDAGAEGPAARYAIVVKQEIAAGPWGDVVGALEAKHGGEVFTYDASPEEVRERVGAYRPRYVCFVCEPTEDFPEVAVHGPELLVQ